MVHFECSVGPLLVVAFVNFFASWFYYSPMVPWFKAWQRAIGSPEGKTGPTEEDQKAMPWLMLGGLTASFLLSYGLQIVIHSIAVTDFFGGVVVGVVLWAAFGLTQGLNQLFEGRKPVLLVINNGLYLVTYALFAGLVAVWK